MPGVGEPWSLTAPAHAGDARAHCGEEIHDPTLHPISAGAASGDPSHPTAALGGMLSGGAGNRGTKDDTL